MKLILALLAIMATGCSFVIAGDSTAAQLAEGIGQDPGHTQAGCGWTGFGGSPVPCVVPLNPPDKDTVIAHVSIWDVGATNVDGYIAAHEYYSARAENVVWVELPPIPFWIGPPESAQELNDAVADALGCTLHPYEIRQTEMWDGVHYTLDGLAELAVRYELLDYAAWDCP